MSHILIIDDEAIMRKALQATLRKGGHQVDIAINGMEGLEKALEGNYEIVFTDMRMPELGGMEVLSAIKEKRPDIFVVVMTAFGTIESAVEAMRKGAYDYLTKPFTYDEAVMVVNRIMEFSDLRDENRNLRERLRNRFRFSSIIGKSDSMQKVYSLIERIAPTDATVLVCGESGTGKELVANAIHEYSRRKARPFVPVNCSALSETLLESELFGHEKGAFTGALREGKGRFEVADGGSLFLDEIGEISLATQVKLLRVLQERKFERVGSSALQQVDVRIIAATNRNLEEAIREGVFREDLYYRLNVIQIDLPPLRSRTEDIPLLVDHFAAEMAEKNGIEKVKITSRAMDLLTTYHWPGNVRELVNVMERAVILCDGGVVGPDELPPQFHRRRDDSAGLQGKTLAEVEKHHILSVLSETDNNVSQAARILGVDRKTLYNKMKIYEQVN
ncbi:MAG: hypothetical protein CVV64_06795 [Candidatus Wallbacteria bacterium HGW-Wallbacteria-1]|jgi:two-component system response regulator HydG|uniref:Sigma-54-dependent Fis family transcriptional regulator n=1 Tax=Candidatus Wallbacteria bacterium HGW-Wallbacteria-1 TaxID=2013854 RepID=A0A2N1PSY8_9BACT|nr:MAG: hypothetical protein CVV64_06795 [Candidatus Wallbacteria bacterium HGW-Wallbacteria-1]